MQKAVVTTLPAKDVKPGMTVCAHGYRWAVKRNDFDPKGNTGNQPRHLLRCEAVAPHDLPDSVAKGMSLGFLPDAPVTVASK